MGSYVAPAGTLAVRAVVVAEETKAFVAPKYTMLPVAVALKLVPIMVTVVPTGPDSGVKLLIKGCADKFCPTIRIVIKFIFRIRLRRAPILPNKNFIGYIFRISVWITGFIYSRQNRCK